MMKIISSVFGAVSNRMILMFVLVGVLGYAAYQFNLIEKENERLLANNQVLLDEQGRYKINSEKMAASISKWVQEFDNLKVEHNKTLVLLSEATNERDKIRKGFNELSKKITKDKNTDRDGPIAPVLSDTIEWLRTKENGNRASTSDSTTD